MIDKWRDLPKYRIISPTSEQWEQELHPKSMQKILEMETQVLNMPRSKNGWVGAVLG